MSRAPKIRRRYICIAATVVCAAVAVSGVYANRADQARLEKLRQEYAVALKHLGGQRAQLYEVQDGHFGLVPGAGLLLITHGYASIRGYTGPSLLGLALENDGRVRNVAVLRSPDTKGYIRLVKKRLDQLTKQEVTTEKRPVLAVTGATSSAAGISATVNQTLDAFRPIFAKLQLDTQPIRYDKRPLKPFCTVEPAA